MLRPEHVERLEHHQRQRALLDVCFFLTMPLLLVSKMRVTRVLLESNREGLGEFAQAVDVVHSSGRQSVVLPLTSWATFVAARRTRARGPAATDVSTTDLIEPWLHSFQVADVDRQVSAVRLPGWRSCTPKRGETVELSVTSPARIVCAGSSRSGSPTSGPMSE